MTDDIHYLNDAADRPDDHQHAVEACQHAVDALPHANSNTCESF